MKIDRNKQVEAPIYLRDAEMGDLNLLYKWTCDPCVRANSFNSNSITLEEHTKWFTNIMKDKTVHIYICMLDAKPIGQVRIKIKGDRAEISYSIDREYRGQGYGANMLKMLEKCVKKDYANVKYLVGQVRTANVASSCVFEKVGFYEFSKTFQKEI